MHSRDLRFSSSAVRAAVELQGKNAVGIPCCLCCRDGPLTAALYPAHFLPASDFQFRCLSGPVLCVKLSWQSGIAEFRAKAMIRNKVELVTVNKLAQS